MGRRRFHDRIRTLALSLPEAYEDSPWGHPVFKVGDNRMFGAMSNEGEPCRLTVKLSAEEREIALLLPFVEVARYVGRYGWVTATITNAETLEAALEWLRESYWLKAPAELREAAWSDAAPAPAAGASRRGSASASGRGGRRPRA